MAAKRTKIIEMGLPTFAPEQKKRWTSWVPAEHVRINVDNDTLIFSRSFKKVASSFSHILVGIDEESSTVTFWFNNERGSTFTTNDESIRSVAGIVIDNLQGVLQLDEGKPNDFKLTLAKRQPVIGQLYTTSFNKTTLF